MVNINKLKARNLYNKGFTIALLPCNVRSLTGIVQPVRITKQPGMDFDKIVNEYEYYNCNNELGKYTHFYVDEIVLENSY